jgi:hypothetical protein
MNEVVVHRAVSAAAPTKEAVTIRLSDRVDDVDSTPSMRPLPWR